MDDLKQNAQQEGCDSALRAEPASRHPIQPLGLDGVGTLRFKRNNIVDFLAKGRLNDLACMNFPQEDWEQLAQLIGYSLSGFGDLSYVTDETYETAAAMWEQSEATRCRAEGGATKPDSNNLAATNATIQQVEDLPPLPEQAVQIFTCIGKGGEYELVGYSNGAGTKRGETIIVYCDRRTPDMLFHRTADDFKDRMQWIGAACRASKQGEDDARDGGGK